MQILIKVRPLAGQSKVDKLDDGSYKVWVKEPAEKGLANKGVVKTLAKYFKTTQNNVKIISGFTSSLKKIEIS